MGAQVAVIGTGTMGLQMIRRLLAGGHEVASFDVAANAQAAAAALGARDATDAAAAASGAEVCLLSLPGPEEVLQAVAGPYGVLNADLLPAVIADLSTIDQATSQEVAQRASERGVAFIDAPVLGRPDRCGHWTLPVGGDHAAVELARPVLEVFAARLAHVGPNGSGVVVKLLNNLMFAAINAITAECLAGAERLGLSPEVFVRTVADSGAASVSNLFLDVGPRIVESDFTPAFTLALLRKDVDLATTMLVDAGADTPVSSVLRDLGDRANKAGLAALDTSAMVELYRGVQQKEA